MLAALVAASCRRPLAVLVAAASLVVAAIAYAATHFAMTTDATALMSSTVGWRVAEERLTAAFGPNGDVIVAVVDGATPELADAGAGRLAAALRQDRAHFRRVTRPDGGPYLAREGLLLGSVADVRAAADRMVAAQPFLGPLAADPWLRGIADALGTTLQGVERGEAPLSRLDTPIAALAAALDAQAAGRPAFFSWAALFGDAPTRRLVLAYPRLDYGSLAPGAGASDAIRTAASAAGIAPAHGMRVRLTGSVPLSDEELASLADRAWLVGAAMIGAMLVTLRLATRSWAVVAAIMATTLSGLAVTAALGLLAVGRFNLISVAFIPLFVGLGVDFGIQLGVRFQHERLRLAPADAMTAAAVALGPSLALAAGAVCLGFLAFLPTDYIGVAELGTIAGLGMVVALALSATLLPALLMLFRPGRPRADLGSPALAPLDRLLLRRRRPILWVFGLSVLATVAALPLVRFDFNPLHLRDPNGEAMATLADLARDPDRNPNTIEVLAPSLAQADRLATRLRALPEVGAAITASTFVPTDQPAKLAAIGDAQLLLDLTLNPLAPAPPPSDAEVKEALASVAARLNTAAAASSGAPAAHARALAAAFRRLSAGPIADRRRATALLVPPLRATLDQLRAALSAGPASVGMLPPDLRADWIAPTGQARIQVMPAAAVRDNADLARFTRAVLAVAPDATGTAVSMRGAAFTVAHAFVVAGVLAFAVVSLLLLVALRSVREAAFTLAPVVLSIFLTLGSCVVIGQPINFANIIAFPLLFGVGVAFHIYFVMAWRGGAGDLLQSALARAVFFSALATGSAFGSLWLSRHPGTASMGKILMISLLWTLVCALIFEPALLGPPKRRTG